jgi:hypothetical protein
MKQGEISVDDEGARCKHEYRDYSSETFMNRSKMSPRAKKTFTDHSKTVATREMVRARAQEE